MNNDEENIVWFAMRAPFCKELEAKRLLDKQAIENFVPMCYKVFEKNNGSVIILGDLTICHKSVSLRYATQTSRL